MVRHSRSAPWIAGLVSALLITTLGVGTATASVVGRADMKPKKPKPLVVLPTADLQAALLALDEMPTGWAAIPSNPLNEAASATGGYCNGPNFRARADAAGQTAYGDTQFGEDPNNGPLISDVVTAFPTVAKAKSFMAASQTASQSCPAWDVPGESGVIRHIVPAALNYGKVGDQVLAVRQTSTNMVDGQSGASAIIDTVNIRKGNHVVQVSRTALSADITQLQQYVQKAYDKFGVALAAAAKAQKGHKLAK